MTEHNLPVPDDAPWLNLSKEEIEELRQQKQKLTQYGKEKLQKMTEMTKPKSLVARVRELVGHDDTYARDAIREIAKWLEEDGSFGGAKCAFRLEQQLEIYND